MTYIVYFTLVNISMAMKIQATKHALNRFEQRIIPMLPISQRNRMSCRRNIQRALFSICSKLNLGNSDHSKERFEALFYRYGKPPLRLALVINVDDGVLITLWCLGVYRHKNANNSSKI